MPSVNDVSQLLESFAPVHLAEEWDNVGLLVGNRQRGVKKVMTCLTITPASATEAIENKVDLVVTHHPFPFHPLRQITSDTTEGQMLLDLMAAQVAVYSPHTSFDSARYGINQSLVEGLQLKATGPLIPALVETQVSDLGSGRFGSLNLMIPVEELAERVKSFISIPGVQIVAENNRQVHHIAVACGSGGSFLKAAREKGCDCLVTGETTFHTCLEAEATGVALILTGHYASERFAVEKLAEFLASELADTDVWASRKEKNPLRLV